MSPRLHTIASSPLPLPPASSPGKSTIISLLLRFYDPSAGSLLLDGLDLRSLHLRSLRSAHLGLVQQEPALFATSLRNNLRFACPDASEAEMLEALEVANARAFVMQLPDTLDTEVGGGGKGGRGMRGMWEDECEKGLGCGSLFTAGYAGH